MRSVACTVHRGSELMLQSMRRTADALSKAVYSKVFDRDGKN
jgi:hypothetical protein